MKKFIIILFVCTTVSSAAKDMQQMIATIASRVDALEKVTEGLTKEMHELQQKVNSTQNDPQGFIYHFDQQGTNMYTALIGFRQNEPQSRAISFANKLRAIGGLKINDIDVEKRVNVPATFFVRGNFTRDELQALLDQINGIRMA